TAVDNGRGVEKDLLAVRFAADEAESPLANQPDDRYLSHRALHARPARSRPRAPSVRPLSGLRSENAIAVPRARRRVGRGRRTRRAANAAGARRRTSRSPARAVARSATSANRLGPAPATRKRSPVAARRRSWSS